MIVVLDCSDKRIETCKKWKGLRCGDGWVEKLDKNKKKLNVETVKVLLKENI